MRKKLIDLLLSVPSAEVIFGKREGKRYTTAWHIANHLIANGVTIQEWIPVKERLPDDGVQVLACTKHGKPFPAHCRDGKWRVSHSVIITHWMPLPTPLKGE